MPDNNVILLTLDHLTRYDGKLKTWTAAELAKFSMVKLNTATTGYAASYELQFDGTKVGQTIDIPKDFMLKDASIEECETADVPVAGYKVGDLYFDFTINVDSGTSTTEKHVYLLVSDAFAGYDPGNGITISGGAISAKIDTNAGLEFTGSTEGEKSIGVKTGDGIEIDATSKAVTAKVGDGIEIDSTSKAIEAKVGDGITIDGTSKAIKADLGDGLQANSTSKATEVKTGDGIAIDSTSKAVKANVGTGLEINSTSKAIDLVAQSSAVGAPAVGGVSTSDYAAFKGAADTFSATAGSASAGTAVGNVTPYTKTITVASTDVGGTQTSDAFHFDVEWKEYGNATATSGQTAAAAGLMSGTDKDNLDALIATLGNDVALATNADIDALFE